MSSSTCSRTLSHTTPPPSPYSSNSDADGGSPWPAARRQRTVTRDHEVDVLEPRVHLLQRARKLDAGAAVAPVAERAVLPCEGVAGMQHAQRGKDDEGVAARVRGAEVIEIDPVLAGA